ncbi:hypothetical protein BUL40_09350 [Croceivirga radicis]|uniref:Thioredoxin domain-containing protein n=1 Tax=Croceivirga radicis TaxID=1929488 RepID=A0A1V6LRW9_9FLAO|nr:TlpA disulfide reductase family protein [Croceivirga radicis]OQD42716.1 hypothetical protein BUL40_09350 [Croceivirga radicis]
MRVGLVIVINLIFNIIFVGCSQKENREFQLYGKFKGTNTEQLIFIYQDTLGISVFDTIPINNGKFYSKGFINGAIYARIEGNKKSQRMSDPNVLLFFIEPGKNYISLSEDKFKNAKIIGSATQKEHEYLENQLEYLHLEIDSIKSKWNELLEKKINNPDKIESIDESIVYLSIEWENRQKRMMNVRLNYLRNNPQSYLNPYWLKFYSKKLPIDTLEQYYKNFKPEIKSSLFGKQFEKKIELARGAAVNSKALSFKLRDVYGNEISLENFKDEFVLLDFWASWCAPCLENHPDLIRLYKKYNCKGFQIIGVSIDENKKAWKEAIKREGVDIWHHVNSWDNQIPISELYNIKPIPALILIDEKGVIEGRYLAANNFKKGFSELERDLDMFLD